eukprot:TRINITY_DN1056_c1_g1_i1.p2 TRINITY_DN1056_c1_g1~~TRINITY_DN1056_c1_g1_i1.p2  ORF type:complete len:197 (+),score=48.05 TRINITY_DN1056_c1_g1_i1:60-593(+)
MSILLGLPKYFLSSVMSSVNRAWNATVGNRIISYTLEQRMPKNLGELLSAEEEIIAEWKRKMAAQGVQVTIKSIREAPFPQRIAMMRALKEVRDAHPTHASLAKSLEEGMWETWHHAPATYRNWFSREITYGMVIGLGLGAVWKYGYELPLAERTEDYYRQLYKQNPELWPALTQRK